jgi:hypothetical protein
MFLRPGKRATGKHWTEAKSSEAHPQAILTANPWSVDPDMWVTTHLSSGQTTRRTSSAIFLGIVGPTAGRFLIDLTARVTAKQFVRGEWFVGTAVLTSIVFLLCAQFLGLSVWPATLISVAFGFVFRVTAVWQGWEEPMPKMPPDLIEGLPEREAFKQKRHEEQEVGKQ